MLSLIGIFYGGLVAFAQTDLKKVIAYSSVSHMGYIILGLFAFNSEGVSGAIFQILAHAVSTGGLFILVGILYAKSGSRRIVDFGGLAEQMPRFAILFMICTLSSIALPSTSGFVGEFLILFGLFKSQPVFASIAVFGVVVSAVYMLNVTKRVMFGHILAESPSKIGTLSDLNLKEVALMSPLVALIFLMGVYPKLFLNSIEKSVEHLVSSKGGYYLSISSSGKMTQENEQESVSEVSP